MIFITNDKNSKFAKMVFNDFPNVVILETTDDDIYSKLDVKDSVYIDSNSNSEEIEYIILALEVIPKDYKIIKGTPTGYNIIEGTPTGYEH